MVMQLELVNVVTSSVIAAYLWSSFFVAFWSHRLPTRVREMALDIRMELKPFMLPAVLGDHLVETFLAPAENHWFGLALNLLGWLVYRNLPDDDDRWKKRRKKLTESVQQVGGRLQVVPVGGRS